MNSKSTNDSEHETKWEIRVLQTELLELHHEHLHISRKSAERPLSMWEKERLKEICDEITTVLVEINKSSGAYRRQAA